MGKKDDTMLLSARLASRNSSSTRVARALLAQPRMPMSAVTTTKKLTEMSVYDGANQSYLEAHRVPRKAGEPTRRAFNYFFLGGLRAIYSTFARVAVLKFLATMSASADVLALSSTEIDVSAIPEGESMTIKWRGKPVFIRHRSQAEIDDAANVTVADLRDPEEDSVRVLAGPEWLVVLGVCTHLGCVPIPYAGEYRGYFCPCHGSHYDTSGRIRKGPAPLNLELPPYKFLDDGKLLIG